MSRTEAIRKDGRWFVLIITAWLGIGIAAGWPASWWLTVDRFEVMDTTEGVPPVMVVERNIKRDFRGRWVVTVMKEGARGFHAWCTSRGENDYRTDAALPDVVTLDWWTDPRKCKLPPGNYLIKTLWVITPPVFPNKEVRVMSNVFRVLP